MTPILYSSAESEFRSNGIGSLSDAIECKVTEERNGVFELNMTYPISGQHFNDLKTGNIIYVRPSWSEGPQPFDIKTVTPSTDGMTADVYAQHISYRLSGIPVKPFSADGIVNALNGLVRNSMIDQGFTVWTDISNDTSTFTLSVPQSFRACLGGTDGSILQTFSGSGSLEYLFDGKQVKVYRDRGKDNHVSIRYGKNLSSLKQETSIENTYTGVLAYWADSQTGESVSGDIQYVENHENYPHERIFLLDASSDYQSDEKPTAEDLNSKAAAYVISNDIGSPSINLDISFVDLSQTEEYKNIAPLERVNLCDTVTVYFPSLGVNAKSKVIKTEWDALLDRYDSIELGSTKSTFSETIQQEAHAAVDPQIKETRSVLQQAIDAAADLLKGGTSGHMVIGTNASGEANELYFMDTGDKATAKNVLRINMNGIAFSTTGINGTYTGAWTIDGAFNADFITVGTLRANLIKAGVLSDEKGLNTWNMETGEFNLSASSTVGGSTIVNGDTFNAAIDATNSSISQTVTQITSVQHEMDSKVDKNDYDDQVNSTKNDLDTLREQVASLRVESDNITAQVTDNQRAIGEVKQATAQLTTDGLNVDTGLTTVSTVDGKGLTVKDKTTNEIIANFTTGQSTIQNLKVQEQLQVGSHMLKKMDGEEYDGTTVSGTGFMWTGGE